MSDVNATRAKSRRSRLYLVGLAVLILTVGAWGYQRTRAPRQYAPGLHVIAPSKVRVGKAFTIKVLYAGYDGLPIETFWENHYGYFEWKRVGGRGWLKDLRDDGGVFPDEDRGLSQELDTNGVLSVLYRATAPGECVVTLEISVPHGLSLDEMVTEAKIDKKRLRERIREGERANLLKDRGTPAEDDTFPKKVEHRITIR